MQAALMPRRASSEIRRASYSQRKLMRLTGFNSRGGAARRGECIDRRQSGATARLVRTRRMSRPKTEDGLPSGASGG